MVMLAVPNGPSPLRFRRDILYVTTPYWGFDVPPSWFLLSNNADSRLSNLRDISSTCDGRTAVSKDFSER